MAKYYKYRIKNLEPLRIADDDTSQMGQTSTLYHIPGSAVRGLVINRLASAGELDGWKSLLFSNGIRFLNAYPAAENRTLIPSPMGFYEDKRIADKKEIYSIFQMEDTEGRKRAAVGRYCYLEDGWIHYDSVETGSDLKIMLNPRGSEKTNVFREEYIAAGQIFEGYVILEERSPEENSLEETCAIPEENSPVKKCVDMEQKIAEFLTEGTILYLGSGRSSGMGKCQVISSGFTEAFPYTPDFYDAENSCYMMLLSPMTMRGDNGEYVGIHEAELREMLGVEDLVVAKAATSIRQVKGYNRTWRTRLPSVPMYEAGSVFLLRFKGTLTAERMKAVCEEGIGIRRNEGFGRILFLKGYDTICGKQKCDFSFSEQEEVDLEAMKQDPDEWNALCQAANGYYRTMLRRKSEEYVVQHPFDAEDISSSQLGIVEGILTRNRYDQAAAERILKNYFDHAAEKEGKQNIHKRKASLKKLKVLVDSILGRDSDLNQLLFGTDHPFTRDKKVMGVAISAFFTEKDEWEYRQKLLMDVLRFAGKE